MFIVLKSKKSKITHFIFTIEKHIAQLVYSTLSSEAQKKQGNKVLGRIIFNYSIKVGSKNSFFHL